MIPKLVNNLCLLLDKIVGEYLKELSTLSFLFCYLKTMLSAFVLCLSMVVLLPFVGPMFWIYRILSKIHRYRQTRIKRKNEASREG